MILARVSGEADYLVGSHPFEGETDGLDLADLTVGEGFSSTDEPNPRATEPRGGTRLLSGCRWGVNWGVKNVAE